MAENEGMQVDPNEDGLLDEISSDDNSDEGIKESVLR